MEYSILKVIRQKAKNGSNKFQQLFHTHGKYQNKNGWNTAWILSLEVAWQKKIVKIKQQINNR